MREAADSGDEDDLAELPAEDQAALGGGAVRERHHGVHDGPEPACVTSIRQAVMFTRMKAAASS